MPGDALDPDGDGSVPAEHGRRQVDDDGAVPRRVALDPSEMGGDPVCWVGLVDDHRDHD